MHFQVVRLAKYGSYTLPLLQLDLAGTTGLTNVDVNRTVQEFQPRRLFELKSVRLTIPDLPQLGGIRGFMLNYLHL